MADQGKLLRKLRRKQALFQANEPEMARSVTFLDAATLNDVAPDDCELQSTYHFFLGNGGTRTGISRDILVELLEGVESLYMPPSKDFSFASVTGTKKAKRLLSQCHGINVQEACKTRDLVHLISSTLLQGPPLCLYVSLIDSIPDNLRKYDNSGHPILPPGLILVPEFITQTEERELLLYFSSCQNSENSKFHVCNNREMGAVVQPSEQEIAKQLPIKSKSDCKLSEKMLDSTCLSQSSSHHHSPPVSTTLKHRTVSHYGYEFLYGSNTVDPNCPLPGGIPSVCDPIVTRMIEQKLLEWLPDQLTVNEYLPGAGIPPHVDTHSPFEDGIASLSLGSQVVMDFKHPDGVKVPVFLSRRSLLVMTGESRYLWSHGITPRKTDEVNSDVAGYNVITSHHSQPTSSLSTVMERGRRVSLTFRKVKRAPCICRYPSMCDSQSQQR